MPRDCLAVRKSCLLFTYTLHHSPTLGPPRPRNTPNLRRLVLLSSPVCSFQHLRPTDGSSQANMDEQMFLQAQLGHVFETNYKYHRNLTSHSSRFLFWTLPHFTQSTFSVQPHPKTTTTIITKFNTQCGSLNHPTQSGRCLLPRSTLIS